MLLTIYLVVSLMVNVTASILAHFGVNNLPLLHLYTVLELSLLLMYLGSKTQSYGVVRASRATMVIFNLLAVINVLFVQSIFAFNSYVRSAEAIILIAFTTLYLAEQQKRVDGKPFRDSGIWISGGLLLYFGSSLFQFTFSNLVSQHVTHPVKMFIWNMHATFVLIMYVFFSKGMFNEFRE